MRQIKNKKNAGFWAYLLGFSPTIAVTGVTVAIIGFICFCITTIIGDGNYSLFWISSISLFVSFVFANIMYFGFKYHKQFDRFQKANVAFVMRLLLGTSLLCYTLAADKLLGTLLIVFAYYPMVTVIWCVNSSPGRGGLPWN